MTTRKTETPVSENKPFTAPKRMKRKTYQIIAMAHRDVLYCEITGPAYEADILALKSKDGNLPIVYPIIDLETQDEAILIANAIIRSTFDTYGDTLTGKRFELRKGEVRQDKKYRVIDIWEIE